MVHRKFTLLAVSAVLAIGPSKSWAGRQNISVITNPNFAVMEDALAIKGRSQGKLVQDTVRTTTIKGTISGIDCQGLMRPCRGRFHINSDRLMVDIRIDSDQDGNSEKVIRNIPVGQISDLEVLFDVPVRADFVQERYSFIEKLQGLKDKDFVALTMELFIP